MPVSGTILSDLLGIPIRTFETVKDSDKLVLRVTDQYGGVHVVKFYRETQRETVHKTLEIGRFLSYLSRVLPVAVPASSTGQWVLLPELRWAVVYPWLEGRTPVQITPAWCKAVGRSLAILHQGAEGFGQPFPLVHIDHHLMENIEQLVVSDALYAALPDVEKRALEQSMREIAAMFQQWGYGSGAYGIIHSDLHLGNWLRRGKQAIPIDFDEAAYGHYLTDLGVVLKDIYLMVPSRQFELCTGALLDSYTEIRPLKPGIKQELPKLIRVAAALYLNWALSALRKKAPDYDAIRKPTECALKILCQPDDKMP